MNKADMHEALRGNHARDRDNERDGIRPLLHVLEGRKIDMPDWAVTLTCMAPDANSGHTILGTIGESNATDALAAIIRLHAEDCAGYAIHFTVAPIATEQEAAGYALMPDRLIWQDLRTSRAINLNPDVICPDCVNHPDSLCPGRDYLPHTDFHLTRVKGDTE